MPVEYGGKKGQTDSDRSWLTQRLCAGDNGYKAGRAAIIAWVFL